MFSSMPVLALTWAAKAARRAGTACGCAEELIGFLDQTRGSLSGWLSFYWGMTPEEGYAAGTLARALQAHWIESFSAWGAALPSP